MEKMILIPYEEYLELQNIKEKILPWFEKEEKRKEQLKKLFKTIEELELGVRSYNCLRRAKINYYGDLVTKTGWFILKIEGAGRKSLREIKDELAKEDLSLDMNIPDWNKLRKEHIEEQNKTQ